MRNHASSSHQRPLSVHASKPTSSVMPVPSVPSRVSNSSMSVVQRLDSLVGSPRTSCKDTGPSPRSYTSQQHPDVPLRSKSSFAHARRPVSAVSATSAYSQNPRSVSRLNPHDVGLFARDMTSTPIASRALDIAAVSPIVSSLNPAVRKDVPPPEAAPAPSPIRRDVPPDPSMYGSLARRSRPADADHSGASSSDGPSFQRRPPTPKQEASSDDTDKHTQWYEYGCV